MRILINDDHIKQEKFTIKSYGVLIEAIHKHTTKRFGNRLLSKLRREEISNAHPQLNEYGANRPVQHVVYH